MRSISKTTQTWALKLEGKICDPWQQVPNYKFRNSKSWKKLNYIFQNTLFV